MTLKKSPDHSEVPFAHSESGTADLSHNFRVKMEWDACEVLGNKHSVKESCEAQHHHSDNCDFIKAFILHIFLVRQKNWVIGTAQENACGRAGQQGKCS